MSGSIGTGNARSVESAPRSMTPRRPPPSRRQLLALSAALGATVLTAAVAIAGLTRVPASPPASTPTVNQIVSGTGVPVQPPRLEPGD
jgi:hypothetical protein